MATTWAVNFPDRCIAAGDASTIVVTTAGESKRHFEHKLFPGLPPLPIDGSYRNVGYFARANHCFVAYAPFPRSGSSSSSNSNNTAWTLLNIDPLAAVTADTSSGSVDPNSVTGTAAMARAINFKAVAASSADGSMPTLRLLAVVPIGGVSACLICIEATAASANGKSNSAASSQGEDASSSESSTAKTAAASALLHIGCVRSLPRLFSHQPAGQPVSSSDSGISASDFVEWVSISVPAAASAAAASSGVVNWKQFNKHKIVVALGGNGDATIAIEQNSLTDKISVVLAAETTTAAAAAANQSSKDDDAETSTSAAAIMCDVKIGNGAAMPTTLRTDANREMSEECCICMMPLLPTGDDPDTMPAVQMLSCGHGFHRDCLAMDLKRADDFIQDGRYCRFRRLECMSCRGNMRDALRFPEIEWLFGLRCKVDALAKEIDSRHGGSAGDDEPLEDRLKRHLFYSCNKCRQPFYGGPYDCGATLSDPKTKPENLVCDACCSDFSCDKHGRSQVVYKCHNCWGVAKAGTRFLGRLRLCEPCVGDMKGKPAPADHISPEARAAASSSQEEVKAAPAGTPFFGIKFAVAGHDGEGVGLSVAGCRGCNPNLPDPTTAKAASGGSEKK